MKDLVAAVVEGAPDPEDAERRLERILGAAADLELDFVTPSPDELAILVAAVRRAPYLSQLIVRDPTRLARVASDPYLRREKPAEAIAEQLEQYAREVGDGDGLVSALRQFRADELLRLGFRELELGTPMEVGRELSALADASFETAIRFHRSALDARYGQALDTGGSPVRFTVIGMGKLGGGELNFASDVDVIYAYDTDDGDAGQLTLHDYFARLARNITTALGEVTEDDVVFRVDLRLRPEGSRGALVNSVLSLERYYESFGRPWERQAWLKARPCAGSIELGEEIRAVLRPFVYPRSASPRTIDDVCDLNQRIKRELAPGGVESGFDVKNGVGGIREIEFFVQALQLVHAGKLTSIRSRTTLTALYQLLVAGLVSEGERQELSEAYRYLRHVEHVLQLESGRQTQRLPTDPDMLEVFARRLGEDSAASFEAILYEHTQRVAATFATLGHDVEGESNEIDLLIEGDLDAQAEKLILESMGFRELDAAASLLERARTTSASPFTGSASQSARRVAPQLIAETVRSAAPDQALRYLVQLIRRRGSWALIWRLLDENPEMTRLVITLFATSEYLSRLFVANPDLTDALLAAGRAAPRMSKSVLRLLAEGEDVFQLLSRGAPSGDEVDESHWNSLAAFKGSQVLRIGLADIADELDSAQVCEELSVLADVCLERALDMVEGQIALRHGTPLCESGEPAQLAVLAMGKLGGEELGYASDLDVVFVYSEDGQSDGQRPLDNIVYMTRVAQRLMGGLHALHPAGRLYELDTRLRPSGRKGLLVSSWNAWQRYHGRDARLWEKQALTKLRFAAGNTNLGRRVEEEVQEFLYGAQRGGDEVADMATQIVAMRDRIERELGSQIHGYDIKTGRGGLIDIEFAAQFLQLAHGHECAELRTRRTTEVLVHASGAGLADSTALAVLAEGYRFLRRLEHRMRIVHDRPIHKLPTDADELERLALRVGHASGGSLADAYSHWTQEIRAAYNRILGVA